MFINSFINKSHQIFSTITGLVYPLHCVSCWHNIVFMDQKHQFVTQKYRLSEFFCFACFTKIISLSPNICQLCSHELSNNNFCSNCADRNWHISRIISGFSYSGIIRELIHRFKYHREYRLAQSLVALLLLTIDEKKLNIKSFNAIVPVPLHRIREREREFNQSALLARLISQYFSIPLINILLRNRNTIPQILLNRSDRIKNMSGVFSLKTKTLPLKNILLIDDVTTTGSTLDECAIALKAQKLTLVHGLTVARG